MTLIFNKFLFSGYEISIMIKIVNLFLKCKLIYLCHKKNQLIIYAKASEFV